MSNGKVVVNEELKQELEEAAQDTSKGYQQIRQTGAVAGVGAAVDSDPSACSECRHLSRLQLFHQGRYLSGDVQLIIADLPCSANVSNGRTA